MSHHTVFLEKKFFQDRGSRRKIELEEKVSEEHQVQEPKPNNEPVDMIPPPPHRSSRISYPLERYLDILTKDLEKASLWEIRTLGIISKPMMR